MTLTLVHDTYEIVEKYLKYTNDVSLNQGFLEEAQNHGMYCLPTSVQEKIATMLGAEHISDLTSDHKKEIQRAIIDVIQSKY
jgi:hypothetical protein